jgi:hypothetical protein
MLPTNKEYQLIAKSSILRLIQEIITCSFMATRKEELAFEIQEGIIFGLSRIDNAIFHIVSWAVDFMIWIVILLLKGINAVYRDKLKSNTCADDMGAAPKERRLSI